MSLYPDGRICFVYVEIPDLLSSDALYDHEPVAGLSGMVCYYIFVVHFVKKTRQKGLKTNCFPDVINAFSLRLFVFVCWRGNWLMEKKKLLQCSTPAESSKK